MRRGAALLLCGAGLIGPAPAAPSGAPCVAMLFRPNASVTLNGLPVDLPSLPARLAALAKRNPRPVVCLIAPPGSSYAEVQAAMGVIGKSGFLIDVSRMQAQP